MGEYVYDAWGNILNTITSHILKQNPFRYRGYYYDEETKLYYLNSRYYDPALGRFLNPDNISYLEPETIGGLNLYAYALNNPVMYCDPTGHFAITTLLIVIGAVVGVAAGVGAVAYADYLDDGQVFNGSFSAGQYIAGGLIGGIAGALLGWALPYAGTFFGSSFALASGGSVAVSVTGAQIAGVAALGAGLVMFAKGNGPRFGHNQYENKQVDTLCKKYGLSKEQRRTLHDEISHKNLTYKQIEQLIIELFFS